MVAGKAYKKMFKSLLPKRLYALIKKMLKRPPVGQVGLVGDLRKSKPAGANYGFGCGLPIDSYNIEKFLAAHSMDIHGRVLEIYDNEYSRRFGKEDVFKNEVLHKIEGNQKAAIIADLAEAPNIPSEIFDSIIFTNILQFIIDTEAAIRTLCRILKPGGVALATLPGVFKISTEDQTQRGGEYWRFTYGFGCMLFCRDSPGENVSVTCYGNVLT